MINNQVYAWEDLSIVIEGRSIPLTGVNRIAYGETKVHENLYGRGNVPVSMGRGKKEYTEGTLVIYQDELNALEDAMPRGKSITDRTPFAITVAYQPENGPRRVDKLMGCRLTAVPKAIGSDDTHMLVELKFKPFRIEYGAR